MTKVVIRTDDLDGFFSRAKDAARRADKGQAFDGKVKLSFEEPQRMFTVLSEARRRLMNEVMHEPRSINELANRLRRNGSAITKDVGNVREDEVARLKSATQPWTWHPEGGSVYRTQNRDGGNAQLTISALGRAVHNADRHNPQTGDKYPKHSPPAGELETGSAFHHQFSN